MFQGRPTIFPSSTFSASNDATVLREAMLWPGTDKDAIINVLCRRTNAERMEIFWTFKTAYGKDLIEELISEVSINHNFLKVLIVLLTPTIDFYAVELHDAMQGNGTDEDVLIEILCDLPNYEMRLLNLVFFRIYGRSLESDLAEETSGYFKRILVSLSAGTRDEPVAEVTDLNAAIKDAKVLKAAGVDRWGTDEGEFIRILCLRSYSQIKLIAREYKKLTGSSLNDDIESEFSGDIKVALLAVLRCALNGAEFFAERIHDKMSGVGTWDRDLIRLIVTRSEIDMMDIKEEFQKKYGASLRSFIKDDTSGDFKHALYTLIGEKKSSSR